MAKTLREWEGQKAVDENEQSELTVAEAARLVDRSPQSLRKAIKDFKTLKATAIRGPDGTVLGYSIKPDDLRAYVEGIHPGRRKKTRNERKLGNIGRRGALTLVA